MHSRRDRVPRPLEHLDADVVPGPSVGTADGCRRTGAGGQQAEREGRPGAVARRGAGASSSPTGRGPQHVAASCRNAHPSALGSRPCLVSWSTAPRPGTPWSGCRRCRTALADGVRAVARRRARRDVGRQGGHARRARRRRDPADRARRRRVRARWSAPRSRTRGSRSSAQPAAAGRTERHVNLMADDGVARLDLPRAADRRTPAPLPSFDGIDVAVLDLADHSRPLLAAARAAGVPGLVRRARRRRRRRLPARLRGRGGRAAGQRRPAGRPTRVPVGRRRPRLPARRLHRRRGRCARARRGRLDLRRHRRRRPSSTRTAPATRSWPGCSAAVLDGLPTTTALARASAAGALAVGDPRPRRPARHPRRRRPPGGRGPGSTHADHEPAATRQPPETLSSASCRALANSGGQVARVEPAVRQQRALRRPGAAALTLGAGTRVALVEVEAGEPVVELGHRRDQPERGPGLAADDVALEVPGHVLAHLAQRLALVAEVLDHQLGVPADDRRDVRRGRAGCARRTRRTRRRGRRTATAGPGSRDRRRRRRSRSARPSRARPRRTRCRRCRAPGCR